MVIGLNRTTQRIQDPFEFKCHVSWVLTDEVTGKKKYGGSYSKLWVAKLIPDFVKSRWKNGIRNNVTNTARTKMADFMAGATIAPPTLMALGTGTSSPSAADTRLQTPLNYNTQGGTNYTKTVSTRFLKSDYEARFIETFSANEVANNTQIREIGLFDSSGGNADTGLWARVGVDITKANTEKLDVSWSLITERRAGLAIKSGESIGVSGTISQLSSSTDSTLTFQNNAGSAQPCTIVFIHNDLGQRAYLKFNGAFTGETTTAAPNNYDIVLEDGQSFYQSDEEIEIANVHVWANVSSNVAMPSNTFVIRGW